MYRFRHKSGQLSNLKYSSSQVNIWKIWWTGYHDKHENSIRKKRVHVKRRKSSTAFQMLKCDVDPVLSDCELLLLLPPAINTSGQICFSPTLSDEIVDGCSNVDDNGVIDKAGIIDVDHLQDGYQKIKLDDNNCDRVSLRWSLFCSSEQMWSTYWFLPHAKRVRWDVPFLPTATRRITGFRSS